MTSIDAGPPGRARSPLLRIGATTVLIAVVVAAGVFVHSNVRPLQGSPSHPIASDEHLLLQPGPVTARRDGAVTHVYCPVSERAAASDAGQGRRGRVVTLDVPTGQVEATGGETLGEGLFRMTWVDALGEDGKAVTLATLGDRDQARVTHVKVWGDVAFVDR